jgi:1-deoxy-D-xylulose-5-phosphate reductoisomerase
LFRAGGDGHERSGSIEAAINLSMPARETIESLRRVILLGSTGSIGTQTLEVIAHLNALHERGEWATRYRVVGLATGRKAPELKQQAAKFGVEHVAIAEGNGERFDGCRRFAGPDAAVQLVREVECDVVLGAMVGAAGLPATLAAVELGRDIALANKETLVAAGSLVVPVARRSGSRLLPVDSEHCGVWECLGKSDGATPPHKRRSDDGEAARAGGICPPCDVAGAVSRVVLTASGGAFRNRARADVYHATVDEALKHPTWSMGPKVTIDSASLTNKALELIEAHWLFGLPAEKLEAVIHPESVVHAMVEFADGSVIAQMAMPDMRLPIQAALTFPAKPPAPGLTRRIDFAKMCRLEFAPVDLERFPAVGLGYEVMRLGGTAGAVFNAANEAAVEAFLAGTIPFGRIPELAGEAMRAVGASPVRSLADVLQADAEARRFVARAEPLPR